MSTCNRLLAPNTASLNQEDRDGRLRIIDFEPKSLSFSKDVCISVVGVAPEATAVANFEKMQVAKAKAISSRITYEAALKAHNDMTARITEAEKTLPEKQTAQQNQALVADQTLQLTREKEKGKLYEDQSKAYTIYQEAIVTAAEGLRPVSLNLFVNGYRAPHIKLKALATAEPQVLRIRLEPPSGTSSETAAFWREIVHAAPIFGEKEVSIGLSRNDSDAPDTISGTLLKLKIFDKMIVFVAGTSFAFLAISLCFYSHNSTLLRDNNRTTKTKLEDEVTYAKHQREAATKTDIESDAQYEERKITIDGNISEAKSKLDAFIGPGRPNGTYSLARVQMAFWFLLILAGFLFIWITTAHFEGLLTTSSIALLGISAGTAAIAVQMDPESTAKSDSNGFFHDIMYSEGIPQLHRLQAATWTLVLGVIFIWNVVYNLQFVTFGAELLALIGMGNLTYLGFKIADK